MLVLDLSDRGLPEFLWRTRRKIDARDPVRFSDILLYILYKCRRSRVGAFRFDYYRPRYYNYTLPKSFPSGLISGLETIESPIMSKHPRMY